MEVSQKDIYEIKAALLVLPAVQSGVLKLERALLGDLDDQNAPSILSRLKAQEDRMKLVLWVLGAQATAIIVLLGNLVANVLKRNP